MDGPKIQVYQDESDGGPPVWRWRLVARNGEIVLQGEGHTRETDAIRAATNAARLLDQAADTASIEITDE